MAGAALPQPGWRWAALLGFALIGPVALPAGGADRRPLELRRRSAGEPWLSTGPHSLKAALCVQGRQQLYAFCEQHHVPHRRCGKLLVATSDAERDKLNDIAKQALRNRVSDATGWVSTRRLAPFPASFIVRGRAMTPRHGSVGTFVA